MASIEAKMKEILDIHDKITAEGNLYLGQSKEKFVSDYIIGVEEEKIRSVAISSSAAIVDAQFEGVTVNETGKIPVMDADKFESVLDRFNPDDTITIETTESDEESNLLKISRDSPEKEFYIKTGSEDTIDSWDGAMSFRNRVEYSEFNDEYYTEMTDEQKEKVENGDISEDQFHDPDAGISTKMDAKIEIESKELSEVVQDAVVTEAEAFPLEVADGEFIVNLGDEITGGMRTVPPVKSVSGEAKSEYQYALDGVLRNNSGVLKLYFGNNTVVVIENDEENQNIKYMIAPRSE